MAPGRSAKVDPRSKPVATIDNTAAEFIAGIGALVRRGRARRGLTRQRLAADSGLSIRYLAQIESGEGNPSAGVLKAIADALATSVADLLPGAHRSAAVAQIHELLGQLQADELPSIAHVLKQRLAEKPDRARRIALVGLRGAGKSTLGPMLAAARGCAFIEIDRMVEQAYGASVPLLIEIAGLAAFRRQERACLEAVIAQHRDVVIAAAGGIVSDAENYALLLRRTHAVWITASPQEHMSRVMQQGDFRPMAQSRQAMADLVAILEARRNDYARAAATLDTSGESVEESFAKLRALAERLVP